MADRRTVFIAYARADIAHADQLRAFLSDNNFTPILERPDITPDDARQSTLIRSADAVVLVLTDRSTDNSKCEWEVSEAARLGKPIIAMLPAPLRGDPLPAGMAQVSYIHFYSDPAINGSGWFDGQRRLKAELTQIGKGRAPLPPPRTQAPPPLMPSRFRAPKPKRRIPIQTTILTALIVLGIGAFALSTDLRAQARGLWRQALDSVAQLAPAEEGPTGAAAVSAEDYTPERAATATRGGANVRDYPLLSGDLITNVPEGSALNITGRLKVQGKWWFRVVLEDGTIGFVREDVIRWGRRTPTPAPATATPTTPPPAPAEVAGVQAIEPALSAITGPAGARIRTSPGTNARQIVRLPANAPVTLTGRLRQGQHWWLRVQLEDGRTGYARDDVLRTPEGGALNIAS